jgi:hypothetical protein
MELQTDRLPRAESHTVFIEAELPRPVATPPPAPSPGMVFEHDESLAGALTESDSFVGTEGRIASMLDLVDALLAADANDSIWNRPVTVNTGIYIGLNSRKELVLVVGHGRGPLACDRSFLPPGTADNGWVPIPASEFQAMLAGRYGPVSVIDLKRYPPPKVGSAYEALYQMEAVSHPMIREVFGPRTHELFARLNEVMRDTYEWSAPLVGLRDLIRSARKEMAREGRPCGCLLSLSGLADRSMPRPLVELSSHADGQPTRVIAVRQRRRLGRVHPGLQAIRRRFQELLPQLFRESGRREPRPKIWNLVRFDGIWFTGQRRQPGEMSDRSEPEYVVKQATRRLATVSFRTTIKKRKDRLEFDQRVMAVVAAKHRANAYRLRGPVRREEVGGRLTLVVEVDLYRVAVRTKKRLPTWEEIAQDWDALLSLKL